MSFTIVTKSGRHQGMSKSSKVETFTRKIVRRGGRRGAADWVTQLYPPVKDQHRSPTYEPSRKKALKPNRLAPRPVREAPPMFITPVSSASAEPVADAVVTTVKEQTTESTSQQLTLPRWDKERWLCHCTNNNSHAEDKHECRRCGDLMPPMPVAVRETFFPGRL